MYVGVIKCVPDKFGGMLILVSVFATLFLTTGFARVMRRTVESWRYMLLLLDQLETGTIIYSQWERQGERASV